MKARVGYPITPHHYRLQAEAVKLPCSWLGPNRCRIEGDTARGTRTDGQGVATHLVFFPSRLLSPLPFLLPLSPSCYLILGLWPLAGDNLLPRQLLREFLVVLIEMQSRRSFWVGCRRHLSDKSLGHHPDCTWRRWYSSYRGGRRVAKYCFNCEI